MKLTSVQRRVFLEDDRKIRELERRVAQGDEGAARQLEREKTRSMGPAEVMEEILKVNLAVDRIVQTDLDRDEFSPVYIPKLPYGADVARDYQAATQNATSAYYWASSNQHRAWEEQTRFKKQWIGIVKDLAGDYNLTELYHNPTATHQEDL